MKWSTASRWRWMNRPCVVMPVMRISWHMRMMRNIVPAAYKSLVLCSLQMIAVLEPLDDWFGDDILSDVQLQVTHQMDRPPNVAFVAIDLVKPYFGSKHMRRSLDGCLDVEIILACVHTVTPSRILLRLSHRSKPPRLEFPTATLIGFPPGSRQYYLPAECCLKRCTYVAQVITRQFSAQCDVHPARHPFLKDHNHTVCATMIIAHTRSLAKG